MRLRKTQDSTGIQDPRPRVLARPKTRPKTQDPRPDPIEVGDSIAYTGPSTNARKYAFAQVTLARSLDQQSQRSPCLCVSNTH
eukprot:3227105-Prymnesium_polylepis.1